MSIFETPKRFFRRLFRGLSLPIETKIFGSAFPDFQGALQQSEIDDQLQIVHLPLEKYPYNAYVYSIPLNRILGYVPKELAEDLLYVFGDGYCLDGELFEKYDVADKNETPVYEGRIAIFKTTSYMKPHLETLPYLHGETNFNE